MNLTKRLTKTQSIEDYLKQGGTIKKLKTVGSEGQYIRFSLKLFDKCQGTVVGKKGRKIGRTKKRVNKL